MLLALPIVVTAQTRVDFDRQRDFSRYKTFALEVEPAIRADGEVDEYNALTERRLRQAVTRQLQARGLEETDLWADLIVLVSSRETEQTVAREFRLAVLFLSLSLGLGLEQALGIRARSRILGLLGSVCRRRVAVSLSRRVCDD